MSLFRSTQVNLPPLVLAKLVELHRPVVVHLHHEAPGPFWLEDAQDVHHGELVRLLAQVDVGTLPPGVAGVFGPGVVIWFPSVQFLPAEVAPHQIRLVLPAAAVEARLGHPLRSAGAVLLERPVPERLQSGGYVQHNAVIGLAFLHFITVLIH